MLGLSRLFADDTSIGHTALDESTLKNMINIDLNNFKKWGDTWLAKFNHVKSDFTKGFKRVHVCMENYPFKTGTTS